MEDPSPVIRVRHERFSLSPPVNGSKREFSRRNKDPERNETGETIWRRDARRLKALVTDRSLHGEKFICQAIER